MYCENITDINEKRTPLLVLFREFCEIINTYSTEQLSDAVSRFCLSSL